MTSIPLARPQVLESGPHAWLLETDDPVGLVTAIGERRTEAPGALREIVPAGRTVMVTFAEPVDRAATTRWLRSLVPVSVTAAAAGVVEIPVRYDGEDVADVAAATGLSTNEVVARHAAGDYVSAFCGFAPGFAYLTGLDPALVLPRRATPRTRVPTGAVAIASEYAAVYPSPSPGGWHLLGHTELRLWDLDRDPPALVAPGTRVRFVAVS